MGQIENVSTWTLKFENYNIKSLIKVCRGGIKLFETVMVSFKKWDFHPIWQLKIDYKILSVSWTENWKNWASDNNLKI